MRKNKAVVIKEKKERKKIKGGTSFEEATNRGLISTKKLYDLAYQDPNVNKIPDLIKNYEKDKQDLSDQIEKYKKQKENIDKNRHNARAEELALEQIENKKLFDDRKNNLRWANFYSSIASATGQNIKSGLHYGIENIKSLGTFVGFAGNGVILRVILIIIFLALIIGLGLASMYSPSFRNAKNDINNKMKDLVNPDFDNYLSGPNPFKGLKDMTNSLTNLIPCDLKYKFTSFTNSINYITTGRNQYEDFLEDRETITTGRCDNIIHMNYNNQDGFQKEKTYCALQPKNITLNFNSNLYPSSDYNQLDKQLREDLSYPTNYRIDIKPDPTSGRYTLDIDHSRYLDDDKNELSSNLVYLPKLFKKDKNKILFNEIKSSSFNLSSGIIGIYGVSLLNKKHKDPIMIINDFNKHNSNITFKTSLYFDNNTLKYYDQNNILQNFEFSKNGRNYYDIEMLLDQSGNNRHFVWKQNDNKYRPMLVFYNNEYAIEFQTRMILYQNIPIEFPKMFIKSTIMVYNGSYNSLIERLNKYKNLLLDTIRNTANITNLSKNIKQYENGDFEYKQFLDDIHDKDITFRYYIDNNYGGKDELIGIINNYETNLINKYNNSSYKAFSKIDSYMDFLSTTSSSSVKLQLEPDKSKYSIKIEPTTINTEYETYKYSVNQKQTIMTNLDNGKIETIGCILDARNQNQKIEDNVEIVGPAGLAKGRNLDRITQAHNFVGFLYDLYIYDRTKMQ